MRFPERLVYEIQEAGIFAARNQKGPQKAKAQAVVVEHARVFQDRLVLIGSELLHHRRGLRFAQPCLNPDALQDFLCDLDGALCVPVLRGGPDQLKREAGGLRHDFLR
jgi:hypothetical protein